ncbi:MAG: GNAT family N-acetyltransferase [Oscillibacter sp.]|nr:GNAT family N-acetyltransferase [Oscillibacter sp.]
MDLKITDQVTPKDTEEIFQNLLEYNLARIEDRNPRKLGVFREDASGRKLAGLIGETHGRWLSVQYLWVDEALRRSGVGSAFLRRAEEEARARGCRYAFVDTFDFQAPEFYRGHGYREVFTLEEYPVTGKRHYYTKEL